MKLEDHNQDLQKVLKWIKGIGLKVNPSKYVSSVNKITVRDHGIIKGRCITRSKQN